MVVVDRAAYVPLPIRALRRVYVNVKLIFSNAMDNV